MSKILKRPMFRKGGPTNGMTGIMSGIQDRQNYAEAGEVTGFPGPGLDNPYLIPKAGTRNYENTMNYEPRSIPSLESLTKENVSALLEAAGERGGYDPLTTFLLQYGPAVASATPRGGFLSTALGAAKEPLSTMLKEKAEEDRFKRGVRLQATGAAIQKRDQLQTAEAQRKERIELANIDNIFKQKLADKQMDLQRELTNAEIKATYEAAKTQHEREMEKIAERQELEIKGKKEVLDYAKSIETSLEQRIIEDIPMYLQEYGNSKSKAANRARYENSIEDQIRTNFGEAKVGGHFDVDIFGKEQTLNKWMKRQLEAGGENKVYFNVGTGKAYLLTSAGLTPVDVEQGMEGITSVTDQIGSEEKSLEEEKKKIEGIKSRYGGFYLPEKIEEIREKSKEKPFGGTGA